MCALCRSNIEGETFPARHVVGGRLHCACPVIFNRYSVAVSFKLNIDVVIHQDLLNTVPHFGTRLLQLFERNGIPVHLYGSNMITVCWNHGHTQCITAQESAGGRKDFSSFTAGNVTGVLNTAKLCYHRLVGGQRMDGQFCIVVVKQQRIGIVRAVHCHCLDFMAIARNKLDGYIRAMTGHYAVRRSASPFVCCCNYFVFIKFCNGGNCVVGMDVLKNIMVGSGQCVAIHYHT